MAFRSTEHCVFSQHVNTWKRSNFKQASWFDVRNAVWDEIQFSIPKGMSITRTNEEVMVRENMPGEMLRQKKYHDAKVSWYSFKPGDMVHVYAYFSIRKSGCSPNLTSYCIGGHPSKPRRNSLRSFMLSRGKTFATHCDQIRKSNAQILSTGIWTDTDNGDGSILNLKSWLNYIKKINNYKLSSISRLISNWKKWR